MDPAPETTQEEVADKASNLKAFLVLGGVVVVALLIVGAVYFVFGSGSDSVTVRGSIVVYEEEQRGSGSCSTYSRGYDDIGEGTEVTISSPDGKELAFGKLGRGFGVTARAMVEESSAEELGGDRDKATLLDQIDRLGSLVNDGCRFEFEIEGVDKGERYYVLKMGRRGEQRIDADELDEPVRLTIGDIIYEP